MMKVLFLHSDYIKVFPKQKAIKEAEKLEEKVLEVKECLVCFIAVERRDTKELIEELIKNIDDVAGKIKVKRIVLYPYVHLTNKPAKPKEALDIIKEAEERLKNKYEVYRAPFGWYKEFEIKVKGHPLAELSRVIRGKIDIKTSLEDFLEELNVDYKIREEKDKITLEISKKVEKREEKSINKEFMILFPDDREYKVIGEEKDKIKVLDHTGKYIYLDKNSFNEDFIKLLDKEALGKPFEEHPENPIRKALERFGFEWESLSDYGHMRYKPYAAWIVDTVSDYAINIVRDLDVPIFIIRGTNMFDLERGPVSEHAKLFGERMYELETDKSKFVLRYAACFQQFSIAKDLIISYKDLPFGMLEIADSYRFEQQGEVVLGFRLRKFIMPDLHIFCKDLNEARRNFIKIHRKIMEEIKKIGRDYELLINVGSMEFYNKYKDLILDVVKDVNKPCLICIYPPAEERYWIINIEYHIIDILGRPREIGTTQIDIGNGHRFGIKYIDENNQERYVIILHNAIIGSIERYIYAIFDTALRKEKPMLPLWLSPVQVRIIPISKEYNEYCYKLAEELEKNCVRVEVDDRDLTVGKKIMEAEKLWIPYIIVIGEKETKNNKLSVRIRESGEIKEMTKEELLRAIWKKTRGFPFRYQYWPKELSKRPSGI